MEIYLVGGAVRDQLMGQPVTERDWVVVGSSPEILEALGYKPVGKDFPVFLHPNSKEEYALARTEKKSGRGYQGFTFHASPEVSLEEDLIRRDLTINAIAMDEQGELIDPFNGQEDIWNKQLRHVSDAFAEDPVRLLRIARFAARYPEFEVHPDTLALMKAIVDSGEIDALVPERTWQEFHKALEYNAPHRFLETMRACGACKLLCPRLSTSPHLPEVMHKASLLSSDPSTRFASMFAGAPDGAVEEVSERFRLPKAYYQLAQLVQKHFSTFTTAIDMNAKQLLDFLLQMDLLRRPNRFTQWLLACQANTEAKNTSETPIMHLRGAGRALMSLDADSIGPLEGSNEQIAAQIYNARLNRLKQYLGEEDES